MPFLRKILLLFLLLSCFSHHAAAQRRSREQLEREKNRNLQKIEETKRVLSETSEKKQATVGQVKVLKERISTQKEQIDLMEEDVQLLDVEMKDIVATTQELEKKLDSFRQEYAATLFAASKSSNKLNRWIFLFSASSFNSFFMRYKYLQQYAENRKSQLYQISKITALLKEKEGHLVSKKTSKESLLSQKLEETANLQTMQHQQSTMVHELAGKEHELRSALNASKRSVSRLENVITKLVEREISKKNRERELRQDREVKVLKNNKTPKIEITKNEIKAEGLNFSSIKGSLPWPVKGFVSDRFGVKEHPVLNGVMINNNGVDIQTAKNASVRAVFNGTVKDISEIPNLGTVVAIQHGDYFTVYANLKSVFVLLNQKVNAKDAIGTANESGGVSEINFQIWHNTEKLNPEGWLAPR